MKNVGIANIWVGFLTRIQSRVMTFGLVSEVRGGGKEKKEKEREELKRNEQILEDLIFKFPYFIYHFN
jgi:hypothetical protein